MSDEPSESDPPFDVSETAKAEPAPQPPPMEGNGKHEPQTISEQVRRARESIPVDDRGVQPIKYEQQVVIAKDLSKAYLMLPSHLHNNAAVLTALVGIAARFQLDPAMLASQSYVQGGKLCFQSQAFGAILYASGLLLGRLRYDFQGEGDELTCTVQGRFKDDPDFVYSATSPTLKQIRPPRNESGVVKGSPLYDRDPEQQIAYFAQRRWIRRFAPDVCMGMYTREEIEEIDSYRAQREGAISLTADRLGGLDTGEGWGEGAHLDAELAKIAPEELQDWPQDLPDLPEEPSSPKMSEKQARAGTRKPVQAKKPVGRVRTAPPQKTRPRRPGRRGRPLSRAVIQAVAKRAELPPRAVAAPSPRWLDYVTAAFSWINAATDPDKAEERWDSERQERDSLRVPMGERSRLRAILDRKITQLRKAKEQA